MRVLCSHCRAWLDIESDAAGPAACPHCRHPVQATRDATFTAPQLPPSPEATAIGTAPGGFHPPPTPGQGPSNPYPERIGDYRIGGILGQGGMGVVLRGRHEVSGRVAAIKTVTKATPTMLQGIRREVLALSQLKHPGLVEIYEVGLDASLPWFAMELLEGTTLAGELAFNRSPQPDVSSGPTLPTTRGEEPADPPEPTEGHPEGSPARAHWSRLLNPFHRLCGTLAYLHGEGVIHRDLKPANIFLRADSNPVLVDFGLSSRLVQQGREVLDGMIQGGTPAYMAPEQIRGEDPDARTDLYSLGCILYRAVTGKPPFDTSNTTRLLRSHLHETPVPPRRLVPDLPAELDGLILRLLAKNPRDRVGYAKDVVNVLRKCGAEPNDWIERWPGRDYLYRPGFVGRQALLRKLNRAVASAREAGGCVFVRGASGVGKTRLVMEMIRQLAAKNVSVFTGECVPISTRSEDSFQVRANPLHPFRLLLQAIPELPSEHLDQGFEARASRAARVLAVVEPSLRALPTHREGEAHEGDVRQSLLQALGAVLESFARRSPSVLVLDDLQWADELTLSFLARYAAGEWRRPGLAIVATFRSEEAEAIAGLLASMPDAPVVDVDRFDVGEVAEIVRRMLSDDSDLEFARFLARQSEGNPFFIAEYLRAALAENLLRREADGRWTLVREAGAEYEAVTLPATLHQLVTGRLTGLAPASRRTIELASVIGREIDGRLLQTVSDLSLEEYLKAVHDLIGRQVLEEREADRFRFLHDKLREVTYDAIPEPRRRGLHRAVAEGIERCYAGTERLAAAYSTLAHHWRTVVAGESPEPGDVERALHYLEKGVQQSLLNGAARQAVEFGRAAARLLGVELPTAPDEIRAALAEELAAVTERLDRSHWSDLLRLPPCDSPKVARAIDTLLAIHPASHSCHQLELFALMAAKNMRLTLRHGRTPTAPCVFAMYSIVTRVVALDLRQAYDIGRLAIDMDRQSGGPFSTIVWFIHGWFVNHWVNPIRESVPLCGAEGENGLKADEILYGCYNTAAQVCLQVVAGSPLSEVIVTARRNHEVIGGRVALAVFHCVNELQAAKALAGRTAHLQSLDDAEFNEARDLEPMLRSDNYNQVGTYHVVRMRLAFYDRDFEAVDRHAALAAPNLPTFVGQISEVEFRLFGGLALVELYPRADAPAREDYLRRIRECLSTFADWSALCPANFTHMRLLLEAGLARCEGDAERAVSLYDEASRAADENGFMNHAPLATELAGELKIATGDRQAGRKRMSRARERYVRWGAVGKARLIPDE